MSEGGGARPARIDELWPRAAEDRSDDELLAALEPPEGRSWLRVNFVASIDGAATEDGRSGGLGDEADRRMFDLLRRACDAVLVGAGTVRVEGYGAMRVDDASARWRERSGRAAHPVFVLASRRLALDPASPVFAEAPVRPVVVTVSSAPEDARRALAEVADVVECGATDLDPRIMCDELARRGLNHVLCEGGPSLFGALLAADVVDELCLTVGPTLQAGAAPRIANRELPEALRMRLERLYRSGDTLLLRYARARE